MKNTNIAEELATFATEVSLKDLPAADLHETKFLLMDSIGCALAALTTDKGKINTALSKRMGGPPESSIIGVGGKVSCISAAMGNGENIGTVDYDAIMAGGHVPPYVLPAPIAMAETVDASGKDLLLAVALGCEISARVAGAVQQTHGSAGFTGKGKKKFDWGTRWGQAYSNFGAAAAAGRLIHLSRDKMTNALGIAGHLSQVLTHARYSSSQHRHMTKYGVPGWQNTGAVDAVLMAEMGYMGDTTIFDPVHGFWKFCGYEEWVPDGITADIGKKWIFPKVTYKLYPCCGMLHGALDCLYAALNKHKLQPEEIESISAYAHPTVEMPCFTNKEIINIADAQFNPRYVFAVAAHRVTIGVEWQDPGTMRDPNILKFGDKITCEAHPDYTKVRKPGDPQPTGLSKVVIKARGGKTYSEEKAGQRGATHGKDLTDSELVTKFRHNASRALTQEKIDKAVDTLLNIEKVSHISEIIQHLAVF